MNSVALPTTRSQVNYVDRRLGQYDRAVYVGAKPIHGGPKFISLTRNHAKRVDCWEIYEPNCEALRSDFSDVVCIDVAAAVADGLLDAYGLVFWHHGPEHLPFERTVSVLAAMVAHANVALVVGCPWGICEQPATPKQPFDAHLSWLLPEDFQRLGFDVSTCGVRDQPDSAILAWRVPT